MTHGFDLPPAIPLDQQQGQSFQSLVLLMQRLLAPDGCPWDREQNHESLCEYVREEASEVIDAIESGKGEDIQEELGDLALQIAFLSELSRERYGFGPDDCMRSICEKLVRRHPHVFGDVEVTHSEQVTANWEAIKAQEKPRHLLSGIPRSLNALMRAQRQSEKAARVGFDWPSAEGSREKVSEEIAELDAALAAGDGAEVEAELGDVLFALVNLARHAGVDAERALRQTCDKFERRFRHVEQRVMEQHGDWPRDARGKPTTGIGLQELDGYWLQAKEQGG